MGPTIPQLSGGFPHSEIHGSTGARPSPRLIAACYVLPRLSVPRHPPNALKRLILANPKPAPPGEPRIRKACSALVSLFIQSNQPNSDQTPPLGPSRLPAPGTNQRNSRPAFSRSLHSLSTMTNNVQVPAPRNQVPGLEEPGSGTQTPHPHTKRLKPPNWWS